MSIGARMSFPVDLPRAALFESGSCPCQPGSVFPPLVSILDDKAGHTPETKHVADRACVYVSENRAGPTNLNRSISGISA